MFIPESRGWRGMAESLGEFEIESRNSSRNRGEASLRPLVEVSQPQHYSYREAPI